MAVISGSLLGTTGVPIPTEIASGSEFTVTLVEGPGYMTIESTRDNNGFYTESANFSSVSSSNMVSTVFGEFIIGSYTGYTAPSNLTFTADKTIPANQLYIKVASSINNPRIEIGNLIDDMFTTLEGRSTFFENEDSSRTQVQVLDTAGILEKASILITPTAYNTGKLNAILPISSPFADFNKAGGTNATRINSSGNVEDISSSYPRIDYEDSSTGVLCEYTATNYLRYSEAILAGQGSPWSTSGIGTSYILMTLPDGSVANATNHYAYGAGTVIQSISAVVNRGVGVSVWAYNPETTAHDITIAITGYPNAPTVISLPPGVWTRCKAITGATSTSSYTGVTFTLASGKNTRLWGAQLERSQFLTRQGVVTSYIPTAATAVTRGNELLVGQTNASLINSEEGVFVFEGKMTNSGTNEFINILGTGGMSSNSLSMYGTGGGTVSGRMIVGGAQQYFAVGGVTSKLNYFKAAIKWDSTTLKTFANGALVTNTSQNNAFSAGDLNQVHISTGQRFYGKLKMVGVFNEALTDAEVIALTT